MPLPLHSIDPSMHPSLHGRPMVDTYNSIIHHNYPATYCELVRFNMMIMDMAKTMKDVYTC